MSSSMVVGLRFGGGDGFVGLGFGWGNHGWVGFLGVNHDLVALMVCVIGYVCGLVGWVWVCIPKGRESEEIVVGDERIEFISKSIWRKIPSTYHVATQMTFIRVYF
jgi:hypothetical protein